MDQKSLRKERLAELIKRWLESGKHNTMQGLANASGISYSTIRKILEGDTTPDASTELSLLIIVATDQEIEEFIEEYQPVTRALLKRVRGKNTSANVSLSQRFWDPNLFWVTMQSYSINCTRDTVSMQLGEPGLTVLDSLVAEKSLVLVDGKYKPNVDSSIILFHSPESVKSAIGHGLEESMKHNGASRSSGTFGVTEKGYAEIKDLWNESFGQATVIAKANEGSLMISFANYVTPVIKGAEK